MDLEDAEAVPNNSLKVLSRSLHEELVSLVFKSLIMDPGLPNQDCVAHALFGNRNHLMVESLSLVLLELDILVES